MSGWDVAAWDWYDWFRGLAFLVFVVYSVRWLWSMRRGGGGESGFPTGLP